VAAGVKTDVSRFGAQVINGVGFLGAGTVLVTERQEVKGLTTAAGLWASACIGLAIGAGFYECMAVSFALMLLSMKALPPIENALIARSPVLDICVELDSVSNIGQLIACIKTMNLCICDVEINRENGRMPGQSIVILNLLSKKRQPHENIIAHLASLPCVRSIDEL